MKDLLDPTTIRPTGPCTQKKSLHCSSASFWELSTDLLRLGKSLRFQAQGNSMMPLVRDCDILVLAPTTGKSIHLGDIVLCSCMPGEVVVHRVIGAEKRSEDRYFLIQGDQSLTPDGWVYESQICGRLTRLERNGKTIHMGNPIMRMLTNIALWHSRWDLGRCWLTRNAGVVLKHLPVFNRFLT